MSQLEHGVRSEQFVQSLTLDQWTARNPVAETMGWKEAFNQQLWFIRQRLLPLVCTGLPYDEWNAVAKVISSHRSKSIVMPVYQFRRPDGLCITLRGNFYDWKVSVYAPTPVNADFEGLFQTTAPADPEYSGNQLHPVYFEGFPEHLVYDYFANSDRRRWSAELSTEEELFTMVFLLMKAQGLIAPKVAPTRQSLEGAD